MKNWELKQRQSLSLESKIQITKNKIRQFYNYNEGNVYVAFSGGKDSTVLLDLVRQEYPYVPAVYVNTGLEYPEINNFVKIIDNVITLRPKMNFKKVLETYGYPVISKLIATQIRQLQNPTDKNKNTRKLYETGIKCDGTKSEYSKLPDKWNYLIDAPFKISEKCCDIMKKQPIHDYEKLTKNFPFVGTMASDSKLRELTYLKTGCNSFNKKPISKPLSFWLEEDIWNYIKTNNIEYSKIYDMGLNRTGCMFCMFGVHFEKEPNRFQKMSKTHPKLYDYCINNLNLKEVLKYINIPYIDNQIRFR